MSAIKTSAESCAFQNKLVELEVLHSSHPLDRFTMHWHTTSKLCTAMKTHIKGVQSLSTSYILRISIKTSGSSFLISPTYRIGFSDALIYKTCNVSNNTLSTWKEHRFARRCFPSRSDFFLEGNDWWLTIHPHMPFAPRILTNERLIACEMPVGITQSSMSSQLGTCRVSIPLCTTELVLSQPPD